MTYQAELENIRKARASKKQAEDRLYQLKVRVARMLKEKKKFKSSEVIQDPEKGKKLNRLRSELERNEKRLAEIEFSQKQSKKIFALLERKTLEERSMREEAERLPEKIQAIKKVLSGRLKEDEKTKLLEKLKQLKNIYEKEIPERLSRLKAEIKQLKVEIIDLDDQDHREEAGRLQDTIEAIRNEISGTSTHDRQEDPGDIDDFRKNVKTQVKEVKAKTDALEILIGGLLQRTPEQLITEWNDDIPILLLPLRVETKFRTTGDQKELLVRIFPDDIFVNTHEEVLTDQEATYGVAYWKALWASTDEPAKKEAWSMLANKFGANRAAWVALKTKPSNWDDIVSVESELQFPNQEFTKSDGWTQAPHTRILPDRFVLLPFRNNSLIDKVVQVGLPIADTVILGPAPLGDDGENPSVTQDGNGRIKLSDDFKWVSDFDIAVNKGLAFRVDLSEDPEPDKGYDQLIVIGLKASADEYDGQHLLEDLINNHHYSRNGFSIVRQGTPTNNTEEADSGFSKKDPLNQLSYFVETGEPFFDPLTAPRDRLSDGQRLAEFLGISYDPLKYVLNAGAQDHTEASAMNSALYAGTLGYFMNSMLNDVVGPADLQKLRYHFTRYVTGRGPLPAIRVGHQPYGILVSSSFPDWRYTANLRELVRSAGDADEFLTKLYSISSYMSQQWVEQLPNLAQISNKVDGGKTLMEILGLQPTSVEFAQRVGYTWDHLKNLESFGWGGRYQTDVFRHFMEKGIALSTLRQFGYESVFSDGTDKPTPLFLQLIFQHYHTELDKKQLIDGLPFSETAKIKFYDETRQKHYIHWLIENAGDVKKLEQKDFGSIGAPTNLLFLMLVNSILLETGKSVFAYLKNQGVTALELVRSQKFMNMSAAASVSPWEVFQSPVNKIVKGSQVRQTLYEQVHMQNRITPANVTFAGDLLDYKEALDVLKDMSTASLERALAEHLDTLAYRLDSWQTSLFARRLEEKRNIVRDGTNRTMGVYLGAYGYLENVTREPERHIKISEDELPVSLRENHDNLFVDRNNGGFVHGPTLNHATAAAILRNGYLTHASPEERDMLAVNLSSERVRRAQYLIDGIRNEQSLDVLLGYQFERGLHEFSTRAVNPVVLNQLIPAFRKEFPIKRTKAPQAGKVTGPEETVNDFQVVNGLALAETVKTSPYIPDAVIPNAPLSAGQIAALQAVRDNVQNSLDALRDVLTAESAYQLAMGNFERAAAVVKAISDGNLPPDIEVIQTVRGTNLSLTNRVVFHFDPTIDKAPENWDHIPLTLRANIEPGINHWLGTVLGDPDKVVCWVKAVDKDDNLLAEDSVTLKELKIQPIDYIYIIRNKSEESGTSELETRIRNVFAQKKNVRDDVVTKIEFFKTGSEEDDDVRSFGEMLPLADTMRNLISGSRAVHARDYQPASKTLTSAVDNPERRNWVELMTRVELVYDTIDIRFQTLRTSLDVVAIDPTDPHVKALRDSIRAVADQGLPMSFPFSSVGSDAASVESLTTQGESLLRRFEEVKQHWLGAMVEVNDASTGVAQKIAKLTILCHSLLGDDFVILPRFNYLNPEEVKLAHNNRAQLLNYARGVRDGNQLVVDEWIQGISHVRPKMHTLSMMKLFNDTFNDAPVECEPVQLPFRDSDTWLAVEFAPETKIDHDTLSFVHYTPQGFDPDRNQCGLLIDDWVEVIPQREEVTGLAFNYNQPNSAPPQAIIMAVTPQMRKHWEWDSLVSIIRDTFLRSKLRAVEPDQLDADIPMLNKFLPALISEFSTSGNNISLDLALLTPVLVAQLQTFYSTVSTLTEE